MSFITGLGIANPPHKLSQHQAADFMVKAMELDYTNARRLKAIFRSSGITSRYSVLSDYAKSSDYNFFPNTAGMEPFPSTKQRILAFKEHALGLSMKAVENLKADVEITNVTHLITVCCTGMYAPGLDIELIKSLGLSPNVQRTCINFMGCYAAINALRLADSICSSNSKARVLIVCTELCSLHFQKEVSYDNFLANAIFSDGSAAVMVESSVKNKAFECTGFFCDLLPDGHEEMAWEIGNVGFEMKLSGYVPSLVKSGIGNLTRALLNQIGLNQSEIKYFAAHPGGKKILEAIEAELTLHKEQLYPSYFVLDAYGNMSSPSVLFVLKKIFDNLSAYDNNESVLAFAFGPGLTLESTAMKIKYT